jgi:prepilin-type N-terminal cleavage/methylation domain-containing protein
MTNDRGMTLAEVLIAVAILTIGLLAVVGMLSSGFSNVVVGGGASKATSYARQKLEELKNKCYNNGTTCLDPTFPASSGTDTPEAGVTRSWTVTQAGLTTAPNRLSQISVTVTWAGGVSGAGGGQQVIMQTMRAE